MFQAAFILLCLTTSCVAGQLVLLLDTPYTEVVPQRSLYPAAWPVAQGPSWPQLPFSEPSQLLSTALGSTAAVIANAPEGLFALAVDGGQPQQVTIGLADVSKWFLLAHPSALSGAINSTHACALVCSNATVCALGNCLQLPGPYRIQAASVCRALHTPADFRVWAVASADDGSIEVLVFILPSDGTAPKLDAVLNGTAADGSPVACSEFLDEVSLATPEKLFSFDSSTLVLRRWEWVTNSSSGAGGVYDDAIAALAYSPLDGTLYVGTAYSLAVRSPDGAVVRLDGSSGLPYAPVTSIAVDQRSGRAPELPPLVWLGTPAGAILYDPDPAVSRAHDVLLSPAGGGNGKSAAAAATYSPALQQQWRYFNGPRWLAVAASNTSLTAVCPGGIASVGDTTFVATAGAGVTGLGAQSWTLQQKAALYEDGMLPRHDRAGLGLVADCQYASFGNTSGEGACANTPCESNGLWTGLQVAAEAFRFAALGRSAGPEAVAVHLMGGMRTLVNVTGISGLPSRSVLAPWEEPKASGGWWHNASTGGPFDGWEWMGDTSSDSTTGHILAYPVYAQLVQPYLSSLPEAAAVPNGTDLLLRIVSYIVANNFTLVDITGKPTKWGHWDPPTLNGDPSWTDERGVNAMQIVAYLTAALQATQQGGDAPALQAPFVAALDTLLAAGYGANLVNAKVEAPCDDNYSDDELYYLPVLTFCMASVNNSALAALDPDGSRLIEPFWASLRRSHGFVRGTRSSLWAGIYILCHALHGRALPGEMEEAAGAAGDLWWTLATWPLEMIDWPNYNSQRLDVTRRPGPNRNYQLGTDAVTLLPANERAQYRWNANPYTLDGGGSGTDETEPGAFLLPYWIARYAGILDGVVSA